MLALPAVLVALAFGTAGSASAAVLCETTETPCAVEQQYPSGTAISSSLATGTTLKFENGGLGLVTCTGSAMEVKTTGANGVPLPANVTSWTFSGCKWPLVWGTCAVSAKNLPAAATLATSGGGNGALVLTSSSFRLMFECKTSEGIEVTCEYGASTGAFSLTGGATATLTATKLPLVGVGGSCKREDSRLTATYSVSSPSPLYVGVGTMLSDSVLCSENKSPCPASKQYPEETGFSAGLTGSFTLSSGFGGWTCENAGVNGIVWAEAGENVPARLPLGSNSFSFGACAFTGGSSCTSTSALGLPWKVEFIPTSNGNGEVRILNPTFRLTCGSPAKCTYNASEAKLTFKGGSSAEMIANKVPMALTEAGFGCPSAVEWSATYKFSAPTPLYIESA